METIKQTIVSVMQRIKPKKCGSGGIDPQALLKKALTKKELQHIKVNYLKQGVLCLSVDSSAWLYNFNLKKEDLLANLNKKPAGIKEVRFFIGETK
jgi:hypothetical protein